MAITDVNFSIDHSLNRKTPFDHLFRPGFVHRDLYVSPQIFDREMQYLFGRTWVYVGHESEIPRNNDFVTRTIGRRPVIMTRDKDGGINVIINRCTHRGALICREQRGNAARFSCGYHAWTFANTGRCIGVPLKHAYGPDFHPSQVDLHRPARVANYRGFVFAAMTEHVPSIEAHLAGARAYLDWWIDRCGAPLVVRNGQMRFDTHANWKTVYDNAGDGYHPPFSHDSMLRVFSKRYGDVDMHYYSGNFDDTPMTSHDLGNGHTLLDTRPTMHAESAWERQHVMPGRENVWEALGARFGEEAARGMLDASTGSGLNLNIFPNLLIIGNQIQVIEPVSHNRTSVVWYSTTLEDVPEELNAIRMRMQEDFPSFGEVDDTAQFEACQAGMEGVPEMEWIDVRRHMDSGKGYRSDDGTWTEPISSDQHIRAYYRAWHAIMSSADIPGL